VQLLMKLTLKQYLTKSQANEITDNTRQNGISTVAVKEDRSNYPFGHRHCMVW